MTKFTVALAVFGLLAAAAPGATNYFDVIPGTTNLDGGFGNWGSSTNWKANSNDTSGTAWTSGNDAWFQMTSNLTNNLGGATYTVGTLFHAGASMVVLTNGSLSLNGIAFLASSNLTLNLTSLSIGAGGITNAGGGSTKILNLGSNVSLTANQTWVRDASGGSTISAGQVNLGGNTLTLAAAGSLAFIGNLTNSGNVVVSGGNVVTFTGTNTYDGYTLILGTMNLNGVQQLSGVVSNQGQLRLTTGGNLVGSAIVGTGVVYASSSGTTYFTNANSYSGGTVLGQNHVLWASNASALGTGPVLLSNANATVNFGGFAHSLGNVYLTNGLLTNGTFSTPWLEVNAGTIGANIAGATPLNKVGAGTLTLVSSNGTWTGPTLIAAVGKVSLAAFGSNISAGVFASQLGTGAVTNNGILELAQGLNTITNIIGNRITGSGSLLKPNASGVYILANSNSYSGGTYLGQGLLILSNANALGTGGIGFGSSGASLDLGGLTITAGSTYVTNGNLVNGTIITPYLEWQAASASSVNVAGTGAVVKTTAGTVVLQGSNSYSGPTTLAMGILSNVSPASSLPFGSGNLLISNIAMARISPTGTGGTLNFLGGTNPGSTFTYAGGATLGLRSGNYTQVSYTFGDGNMSSQALVRGGRGTLVLFDSVGSSATAGLGLSEKILLSGQAPVMTNGMVAPTIARLGQGNLSSSPLFLVYEPVNGFKAATMEKSNFIGSTSTNKVALANSSTSYVADGQTNSAYAIQFGGSGAATVILSNNATLAVGDNTVGGFGGISMSDGSAILGAAGATNLALDFGASEGVFVLGSGIGLVGVPITGSGGLTKYGYATGIHSASAGNNLILMGATSTVTGPLTINAGLLILSNNAAYTGASTLTVLGGLNVQSGSTLNASSSLFYGPQATLSLGGTLTVGSAALNTALSFSNGGTLASSGDIVLSPSGTLTLNPGGTLTSGGQFLNQSPASGGFTLNGGAMTVDSFISSNTPVTTPGPVVLNYGTLTASNGLQIAFSGDPNIGTVSGKALTVNVLGGTSNFLSTSGGGWHFGGANYFASTGMVISLNFLGGTTFLAGANNNLLLGDAYLLTGAVTVAGPSTFFTSSGVITLGRSNSWGMLVISNGGTYLSTASSGGPLVLGQGTGAGGAARDSWMLVDNGTFSSPVAGISFGAGSTNMLLMVTNGGRVMVNGLGISATNAAFGKILVTGSGSSVTNLSNNAMVIGGSGTNSYNQLQVLAGASWANSNVAGLAIGSGVMSISNVVTVAGQGSFMNAGASVTLGLGGAGATNNALFVTNGGTLQVGANGISVGAGLGQVIFDNGTLRALGNSANFISNSVPLLIGAGGLYLDDSSSNITIQANMADFPASPGGFLNKMDNGFVTLLGNNTYSGGTIISNGVLQVGTNNGVVGTLAGSIANYGTLAFSRGDTFTSSNVVTGTGNLLKLGSGTMVLVSNSAYSGATIISNGVLQLGAGGASGWFGGSVSNYATLAVSRSDTVTLSNSVYGGLGSLYVTNVGAGNLILTGDMRFITITGAGGTMAVAGGTVSSTNLVLGGNAANPAVLNITGGTNLVGGPLNIGTGAGNVASVNVLTNGTLLVTNNISMALSVGGGGGGGQGALNVLGGSVSTPVLSVSRSSTGTGTVLLAGGSITISNTFEIGYAGAGFLTVSNGLLTTSPGMSLGATTAGPGYATFAGGTNVFLGGNPAIVLGTGGASTGIMLVASTTQTPVIYATNSGSIVRVGGGGFGQLTVSNGLVNLASVQIGASGAGAYGVFSIAGGTNAISTGLSVANVAGSTGVFAMSGGQLNLGGNMSTAGVGSAYLLGGTLGAMGNWSSVMALTLTNQFTSPIGMVGTMTGPGIVTFAPTGAAQTITLAGLVSGNGALIKDGAGTLVLSNANTFTGGATISNGAVIVTSTNGLGTAPIAMTTAGALGFTPVVDPNSLLTKLVPGTFGTVAFAGSSLSNISFAANAYSNLFLGAVGGTSTNWGVFTPYGTTYKLGGGNGTLVYTNAIYGGSNLVIGSSGTVALTASNPFTGGTLINAGGTLNVGNNGASPAVVLGGQVTNMGTLVLQQNVTRASTMFISGTGAVWKTDANILQITNANSGFSGVFALGAGTLNLGDDNALGTGTFLITNGTVQANAGSGARTITNAIQVGGPAFSFVASSSGINLPLSFTGPVDLGSSMRSISSYNLSNTVFSGTISGAGGITFGGPRILTLSGSNTYFGGTVVNGGILQVLNPNAVPAGASVTVNFGGGIMGPTNNQSWLLSDITGTSTGALVLAANSSEDLDFASAGLQFLSLSSLGTNLYTGALTPYGGVYRFGGGTNVAGTGTLILSNNLGGANSVLIVGNGGGSGRVMLQGQNTYSGGTLISTGGYLQVVESIGATGPSAVGTAATVQIAPGGTFEYAGTTAATNARPIEFAAGPAGSYSLNALNAAGPLTLTGDFVGSATGTNAATIVFKSPAGGRLNVLGQLGDVGLSNVTSVLISRTASATGPVTYLGGTNNTFSGSVTILAGATNEFEKLANLGQASSLGTGVGGGATNLIIIGEATTTLSPVLSYVGARDSSSDRPYMIRGGGSNVVSILNNSVSNANFALTQGGYVAVTNNGVTNATMQLFLGGSSLGTGLLSGNLSDPNPTNRLAVVIGGLTRWTLAGTNTFSGGLTNAGLLVGASSNSFGTGSIFVQWGAAIGVNQAGVQGGLLSRINPLSTGAIALTASNATEALDFAAAGLTNVSLGTIGDTTFGGSYTPFGTTWRLGGGSGTLTFNNLLTNVAAGAASLVVGGSNTTVVLGGANTYSGGTILTNGTLAFGADNVLGSGALTLNAGVTVLAADASARSQTNSLVFAGNAVFGSTNTGSLTFTDADLGGPIRVVTVSNAMTTFSGTTTNGGLTKAGSGTLVLGSAFLTNLAFSGNAGLVQVNGGTLATTNLTVGSTATDLGSLVISGTGTLVTNRGAIQVGNLSGGNSLTISSGADVLATTHVYLGGSAVGSTTNNSVLVSDSGSLLMATSNIFVGFYGVGHQLIVTNGGQVVSGWGSVGDNGLANANVALVTGTNSSWTMTGGSSGANYVGRQGYGNQLIISAGGVVTVTNPATATYVGGSTGGSNNLAVVSGTGSLWQMGGSLTVGNSHSGNALVITNGGAVVNGNGTIGSGAGATGNSMLVAGANSVWTNTVALAVGNSGSWNTLMISNGGVVVSASATIGGAASSSNNLVVVSGAGSLWTNSVGSLMVGNGASSVGNSLRVLDGARVFGGTLGIAGNGLSGNGGAASNVVEVAGSGSFLQMAAFYLGGTNPATALSGGNALIITNGGSVLQTSGDFYIGRGLDNGGSLVLVDGAGSMFYGTNMNLIRMSSAAGGTNNRIVVSGGGTFIAGQPSASITLGYAAGSYGDSILVTGDGSVFSNVVGNLIVGNSGSGGSVLVNSNASMYVAGGITLGSAAGSGGNSFLLDGAGSSATFGGTSVIGNNGTGTVTIADGTLLMGTLRVGSSASSASGTLNLFGGTTYLTNSVSVGYGGYGTMVVGGNNPLVLVTNGFGQINVGDAAGGSPGLLVISNGLVKERTLQVGNRTPSQGTMIMYGGTNIAMGGTLDVSLAANTGSTGTVIIAGADALLVATQRVGTTFGIASGDNSFGQVIVSNGTILSSAMNLGGGSNSLARLIIAGGSVLFPSYNFLVGSASNGVAQVVLNGTTALLSASNSVNYIGYIGTGQLVVSNGTYLAQNLIVGERAGSMGTLGLYGGQIVPNGNLVVGNNGSGVFNMGNAPSTPSGSTLSLPGLILAQNAGSTGTVTLSGGTLFVTNAAGNAAIQVGLGGKGTFNLAGGTLTVDRLIATNSVIGGYTNSTLVLGSGTLNSSPLGSTISVVGDLLAGSGGVLNWNMFSGTNLTTATTNIILGAAGGRALITVSGPGTVWSNTALSVNIGGSATAGDQNQLLVTNQAHVTAGIIAMGGPGIYAGSGYNSSSNRVVVTDAGSILDVSNLLVGVRTTHDNLLLVTNGGLVRAGAVTIGQIEISKGNALVVNGPGSLLTSSGVLDLNASSNSMMILDGGVVSNASTTVASGSGYSGNSILVSGLGSRWVQTGNLSLYQGRNSTLTISNGGVVTTLGSGNIGSVSGAGNSNTVLVSDSGSQWGVGSSLTVGNSTVGNQLLITNGGVVSAGSISIGAGASSAFGNVVLVSSGSVLNSSGALTLAANNGSSNQLWILGGAIVSSGSGVFGQNSAGSSIGSNNLVVVSGSGSVWSNSSTLKIGQRGTLNAQVVVTNGGTLWSGGAISVGGSASNFNTRLLVADGGAVYAPTSLVVVADGNLLEPSDNNQLVVTNGGRLVARVLQVGQTPGSTNTLFLLSGPGSLVQLSLGLGVASNNSGTINPVTPKGVGNAIINDGATLEANLLMAGYSGTGVISNQGAVYQFTTNAPTITPNTVGAISLTDGTISFRGASNVNIKGNWGVGSAGRQLTNLTFAGNNTFRLNNAGTTNAGQDYIFDTGLGATNYVALEMINGNTLWQGGVLGIGSGGSLLISNTVATINSAVTNLGSLLATAASATYSGGVFVGSGAFYTSRSSTNAFNGGLTLASGANYSVDAYSLVTGVVTNQGSIVVDNGSVFRPTSGYTSSDGSSLSVGNSGTMVLTGGTFRLGGMTNLGNVNVQNGQATYGGAVVLSGLYSSDPSTNTFLTNVTVTASGAFSGGVGDQFVFGANLLMQSTNRTQFNLALSSVLFTNAAGSSNHILDLTGSGALDKGSNWLSITDLGTNFAFGKLSIAAGNKLTLLGDRGTNALYVGILELMGVNTADPNAITNALKTMLELPTVNLYYDATIAENAWLDDQIYDFAEWGVDHALLIPIPEPSPLLAVGAGLAFLLVLRRRKAS